MDWKAHVNCIRKMRALTPAPVDSIGCDQLSSPDLAPHIRWFQILVKLMLSSQTKDEVTHSAFERLTGSALGLTIDSVRKMNESQIFELITPVGFANVIAIFLSVLLIG